MGRELIIVWAGRHQRDSWEALCGDYRQRIAHSLEVREVPVKIRQAGDGTERLKAEGRALLAACPEPSWVVALHRQGKARSSREWASWMGDRLDSWPHPVVFLIGSDLGLSPEVLTGVRERISLGPLTLAHELARLVLYEQLYRALSIRAGIRYHRQPR